MEKDEFSLKLLIEFLVAAVKAGGASPRLSLESPASECGPFSGGADMLVLGAEASLVRPRPPFSEG